MIYTVYAQQDNMTFVMRRENGHLSVCGFYFGSPDDEATRMFTDKLTADIDEMIDVYSTGGGFYNAEYIEDGVRYIVSNEYADCLSAYRDSDLTDMIYSINVDDITDDKQMEIYLDLRDELVKQSRAYGFSIYH